MWLGGAYPNYSTDLKDELDSLHQDMLATMDQGYKEVSEAEKDVSGLKVVKETIASSESKDVKVRDTTGTTASDLAEQLHRTHLDGSVPRKKL